MSVTNMAGHPQGRHRLAVLPGLSSRSGTASAAANDIVTTLATLDEDSNNRQLVPLSASNSKLNLRQRGWNGTTSLKSRDSDESLGSHIHSVVSRMTILEEANKAILEEVYRLQSGIRAGEYAKKEALKEEKKVQRELMETIRSSNDVIGQLTSRLRKAEEKLHQERENVKNLSSHSKKLEQALFSTQKEADTQRDTQNNQTSDLRHRVEDLLRKWEKSDRTSEGIVDEFHQMKNKVEMQALEFSHAQNEMKQHSKRMEDEVRQTMQQARLQKDSNSVSEQNNLQLRHLLESRMAETRDAVAEIRNRMTQSESDGRAQMQQMSLKMTDLQSSISDISHRRQEEMQSMEKNRQERHHVEENERFKLQSKIQAAVEEMSDKILQKESRLREEALKKFIDLERLFQKEETSRMGFEKQLREDTEARWNMQQKIFLEEMQAIKEMRRSDRTKQASNLKQVDDCLLNLDKRINHSRRALEKVLLAEITKRENQSSHLNSQLDGVQEQIRVGLSTMQQAIGGLQFQTAKEKDQLSSEFKSRLADEELKLARAVSDVDARLTAISMRLTEQDTTLESSMSQFKLSMREQHNDLLRSANEWRETITKDMDLMRETLKELPQELKEVQERMELSRSDFDTRLVLESESRLKDSDVTKKQLRHLTQRMEEQDSSSIEEKQRYEALHRELVTAQGTISQMERLSGEIRSNLRILINSETKMRLEETSAIKRELARLRVDIQPLLWQHNTMGRTFVKTPMSYLNEWGIYQCARWYDIKMRWLRLLDRGRKRGRNGKSPTGASPAVDHAPSLVPTTPNPEEVAPELAPASVDAHAVNDDVTNNSRNERSDSVSDGRISVIDNTTADDEINYDDVTDDDRSMPDQGKPQPAWYNQEKVEKENTERSENNDGGSDVEAGIEETDKDRIQAPRPSGGDGSTSRASRHESPDGNDDVALPPNGSKTETPNSRQNSEEIKPGSGGKAAPSPSSGKENLNEPSRSESFGEENKVASPPSVAEESGSKAVTPNSRQNSGGNKPGPSGQPRSKGASPSGESTGSKTSTASRARAKRSSVASGGRFYDMEGSR